MTLISQLRRHQVRAQHGLCFYCRQPLWEGCAEPFAAQYGLKGSRLRWLQATAEHLHARCEGGADRADNVVAACRFCNSRRHQTPRPLSPSDYARAPSNPLSSRSWRRASGPAKSGSSQCPPDAAAFTRRASSARQPRQSVVRAGEIARGCCTPERRQLLRPQLLEVLRHRLRGKRAILLHRTGFGDMAAEPRIKSDPTFFPGPSGRWRRRPGDTASGSDQIPVALRRGHVALLAEQLAQSDVADANSVGQLAHGACHAKATASSGRVRKLSAVHMADESGRHPTLPIGRGQSRIVDEPAGLQSSTA